MEVYSTEDVARQLGITVAGVKYHLRRGNLRPRKVGGALVYTGAELDAFRETRRPAGRPPKVTKP